MKYFLASLVLLAAAAGQLVSGADAEVPASCLNKQFVDPFQCCPTPKLLEEAVVADCMKLFPPPTDKKQQIKPDCMSECVMNRTGIFNYKKALDGGKVKETFVENLDDNSVWVKVVNESVKSCLKQAEEQRAAFQKESQDLQRQFKSDRICSPVAGFIMECVHVTVYKECPAKFRKTNSDCVAVFDHLKKCPFYTLFPKKD